MPNIFLLESAITILMSFNTIIIVDDQGYCTIHTNAEHDTKRDTVSIYGYMMLLATELVMCSAMADKGSSLNAACSSTFWKWSTSLNLYDCMHIFSQ